MSNRRGVAGERPVPARTCPMCGGADFRVHFTYSEPPPIETRFPLTEGESYWRELHRCEGCGHFLESFEPDQSRLYTEEYVSALYGDAEGILRNFQRINALPSERSDNVGRVRCIENFWRGYSKPAATKQLLDVGAGLGVFPYRMKEAGWHCTTIDMDERLAAHHRTNVGVKAFVGDVMTMGGIGPFDLVTFNKVLEHVPDPVEMLASVRRLLKSDGAVYVELPDGEGAEIEGKEREEYLLGHMHVFSFASYALLIAKAGFQLITCERLREPSSKFTLRGFARMRAM